MSLLTHENLCHRKVPKSTPTRSPAAAPCELSSVGGDLSLQFFAESLRERLIALIDPFLPFSRSREMVLPDVLQFCDAFELRPGLVSTREVLDAFKEVRNIHWRPRERCMIREKDSVSHAMKMVENLATLSGLTCR